MSRIPIPEWVRLAEAVKEAQTFSDKITAAGEGASKSAAVLIALHYEAVVIIGRLAELVDRGGNTVLIDKAANTMGRWNDAVGVASGLLRKPD